MERVTGSVLVVASSMPAALVTVLSTFGLEVTTVAEPRLALARLDAALFDLAVVPVEPGRTPTRGIEALRSGCAETPIIAVGADDPELVRHALQAGAADYLAWPSSAQAVRELVHAALLRARAGAPAVSEPQVASGLLGGSPQLAAARDTLSLAARGNSTVLIRGETGTGKDLAARAIHAQSPRGQAPFVKVHAPAVPDALLESELFGYEKGAFTGATARKPGRVELAEGGTLFLDEIGEISPTMQAKLLRLIQDREYERLGGTRTLRAEIRLVAATHRDLEHLVDSGAFREDLFYRLNVVTIWLPPLRARRDDVRVIADHYLRQFCQANHKQLTLDAGALQALSAERWPGNVRQLVNLLERLVVLATGDTISVYDVRRELTEQQAFLTQAVPAGEVMPASSPARLTVDATARSPSAAPLPPKDFHFSSEVRPLKEDVRRTELRAITKALHVANGNRALAARLLGVSRRTLYTKLEELGIS
jgi:two-component system, NtrC family, response regulator AtoC